MASVAELLRIEALVGHSRGRAKLRAPVELTFARLWLSFALPAKCSHLNTAAPNDFLVRASIQLNGFPPSEANGDQQDFEATEQNQKRRDEAKDKWADCSLRPTLLYGKS